MFLARAASLRDRPNSLTASTVIPVRSTGVHGVLVERVVLERVRGVAGLGEVAGGEVVGVDDDRRALGQVAEVGPERGRVHRDQHVGGVARGEDVVVGEVHLERRDAGQRALRARGSRPGSWAASTRSLPKAADSWVNRSPVSCMPSPESPANRMMTRSSCLTCLVTSRPALPARQCLGDSPSILAVRPNWNTFQCSATGPRTVRAYASPPGPSRSRTRDATTRTVPIAGMCHVKSSNLLELQSAIAFRRGPRRNEEERP